MSEGEFFHLDIRASGVTEMLSTRFASGSSVARQMRDQSLREVAQKIIAELESRTPVGPGNEGQSLRDSYELEETQEGRLVTQFRISNSKMVKSLEGKEWWLLDLITHGARPHDIPNSFGRGQDFGVGGRFGKQSDRDVRRSKYGLRGTPGAGFFHPGIENPDDFVSQVFEEISMDELTGDIARRITVKLNGQSL